MLVFQHILFVTTGAFDDSCAVAQALSLADEYQARLSFLLICPPLPESMLDYREAYEAGLRQQLEERLARAAEQLGLSLGRFRYEITMESTDVPAPTILEAVRRSGCDLLIKHAEPTEDGQGFRARDMSLLRKCACPIWLHRPAKNEQGGLQIAVAIDPQPVDERACHLALELLRLGKHIAEAYGRPLHVVSCWEYPFEDYLKRNAWCPMPQDEVVQLVQSVRQKHAAALEKLVTDSGIEAPWMLEHLKGSPAEKLPEFAAQRRIDVLVMGTLGRTGIAGFLMGNTSEDVMHRLSCSVVALKP